MTETEEFRQLIHTGDGEADAITNDERGINFYKWYSPNDPMRKIMERDFTGGYKRMAALMEMSYADFEYRRDNPEKYPDVEDCPAEAMLWSAKFNAKQAELAREHNEKILENEVNESA